MLMMRRGRNTRKPQAAARPRPTKRLVRVSIEKSTSVYCITDREAGGSQSQETSEGGDEAKRAGILVWNHADRRLLSEGGGSGEPDLPDLGSIRQKAEGVLGELREVDVSNEEELVRLRHRFLILQLQSLLARAKMLDGGRLSFAEESQALYDATAPTS